MLLAAAKGDVVESSRLRLFARSCLETTDVGRLAIAVLDGGAFAPRRAIELAELVAKSVSAAQQPAKGKVSA